MAEYIERQKAISPLYRWKNIIKNTYGENDEYVRCLTEAIEKIKDVPSADVAPVRHGRWDASYMNDFLVCSECVHYWIYKGDQYDYRYCPNCGAKMDGGKRK